MCRNFEKIPPDEQAKLRAICLEEFANKGYERASTNVIVERAAIPKGTLFYYFGSKKKLFLYLLDQSIQCYTDFFQKADDKKPADLFDRLIYISQIRFRFVEQEPLIYKFFVKAFMQIPLELEIEMGQRFQIYSTASSAMIKEDLDLSRFTPGVDVDELVEMLYLLMEGLFSRFSNDFKRSEPEDLLEQVRQIEDRCREYFEMIKKGVYRTS